MKIADIFGMLDSDDLAQFAGIDDVLQRAEEIGVAQHVADGDLPPQRVGLFLDFNAFFGAGGDGLFQQDIIAAV